MAAAEKYPCRERKEGWKERIYVYVLFTHPSALFQTMAAKRNATGLASAMPRASLNDEELVSQSRPRSIFTSCNNEVWGRGREGGRARKQGPE